LLNQAAFGVFNVVIPTRLQFCTCFV